MKTDGGGVLAVRACGGRARVRRYRDEEECDGYRNFINRIFRPALRRARITDFSWHDLRHTFASRLAMRGVPIRTIQDLMGHRTLAMTLRYAHLSPAHKLDAVRRLERNQTGTTTGTSPGSESDSATSDADATVGVVGEKREWRRPGSNRGPRDYESVRAQA